jgi:hypothetical protein
VQPAASATATAPPGPPQKRTLVEGRQLPSSPVNLLLDPGFALVGTSPGYGLWLDERFEQTGLSVTSDSRSPAGFGGGVAVFQADGATNTESIELVFVAPFPGGEGPFHAEVWVSRSDVSGKPVSFTPDKKSILVSLTDGSLVGEAIDLKPIDGTTHTIGGRTWVLLGVDAKSLTYGGYMIIKTGTKGGRWHLAAPQVVAQPLVQGLPTQSLDLSKTVTRPITAKERQTIDAYRRLQPKLVPAAPNKARAPRF